MGLKSENVSKQLLLKLNTPANTLETFSEEKLRLQANASSDVRVNTPVNEILSSSHNELSSEEFVQ